ncbi:putative bifunctional diguanylate cyclase/phosphodiesterase [Sulfurimonas marina]|uniref:EAL domain-containing protein n=1 Tax=Sulfurimonas marina TaxID=2590551 RepID=A0A7M1AWZ2_9BACT|nr:EAL domain-containing protein [Sulfurimonas marina]QOP41846.1 EAL domain-containing protein [Sulfurimonas marina]
MDFILRSLAFKSIKVRVVVLISALIAFALFSITLLVLFIVNSHMSAQMDALLKTRAHSVYGKLDQRIGYLIDNTVLLTKNELIVNSLIDKNGRKAYLPPLVDNFMEGKDVLYLNIVDFDGRAIFQTQKNIPLYNQSPRLRAALALGKVSYYIEKGDDKLVIIAPIEYYNTTQGAAIVVFKMGHVAQRALTNNDDIYIKLFHDNINIFSSNFYKDITYHSSLHTVENGSYLEQLNVILEIGLPKKIYMAPLQDIFLKLLLLGVVFISIGMILSNMLANGITDPILTLFHRVKNSDNKSEVLCSPLGTNDELEELAKAFDERSILLQHQAQYDALTDLPNRLLFLDRLQQSIKNTLRSKEKFAVLFIDLDHFKEINDSFGHDFGDKLLIIVGEYIESVLRGNDSVARMGGDEFTVLLNELHSENDIIQILQKIMELFRKPFIIAHRQFYVTCSIGIAMYPLHGKTPEELLKNADAAMYKAKDRGRNTYQFYTNDMTEKAYERITLETQLREAIVNREFEVYFQPQVNINDNKIIGMEALVRWNHPQTGLVPPGKFIPLAEDTGLIVEIDRQVMQDAMKQFQKWIDLGLDVGVLSINLSMIQLNHEDFIEFVKTTIKNAKISTDNLMFEVTETQVMKNPKQAIFMLQQLKDIGIRLAIDDFGTGHSSLSYIKRLPIDKLKIDQSFVMDALVDKDDRELTRAIISIANSLNLEVIAEGVETKEQAEFLVKNGCVEAQGYFYYKPLDVLTLTKELTKS